MKLDVWNIVHLQYLKFLERLGKVLVVNAIAVDVGLDGMSDAILARAEQLIKNEATEIADRKSHIFNLQRKLKIMKDQLDSKVRWNRSMAGYRSFIVPLNRFITKYSSYKQVHC